MLVRDHWDKTPGWLRLVLTSRPEAEVVTALASLSPHVLDAGRKENVEDLRGFLERELRRRGAAGSSGAIEAILERSEGVFLYLVVVLDELDKDRLSLDRIEEFPVGLSGYYQGLFDRQFPDKPAYAADLAPLLSAVCAGKEPVPLGLLARVVGGSEARVRALLARLGSLFPLRGAAGGRGESGVAPFHKSVKDWLTAVDERTGYSRAGQYALDVVDGERRLAQACWSDYGVGAGRMTLYALMHAPYHLTRTERWEDLGAVLSDLAFVQAKVSRLGVDELEADTRRALDEGFPQWSPRRVLEGLARALEVVGHRLRQRPGALFQELYNQASWHDRPDGPLYRCLEGWRREYEESGRGWIRSSRPPVDPLGGALLRTLAGHTNEVTACAVTPDGARVVSASDDRTLKVWALATGQEVATLSAAGALLCCAVAPDSRQVVAGGAGGHVYFFELVGWPRH